MKLLTSASSQVNLPFLITRWYLLLDRNIFKFYVALLHRFLSLVVMVKSSLFDPKVIVRSLFNPKSGFWWSNLTTFDHF